MSFTCLFLKFSSSIIPSHIDLHSHTIKMEFRKQEDSRSSSEESDDTAGMGRSYECVFCKRGFTTAQALGGHMNIHRKDRAKTKPPPSSSSTHHKLVDLGFYSAPTTVGNYDLTPTTNTTPDELHTNYPHQFHHHGSSTIRSSSHHVADWRTTGLRFYSNPFDKTQDHISEDGLDLELRLGYLQHP